MSNNQSPFFVYVMEIPSYGANDHCKIGVSKDPDKRLKSLSKGHGWCTSVFKSWPTFRADAFRVEAMVIANFTRMSGREYLSESPTEVAQFVDDILSREVAL
jgi:hypothetical protein